MTDPTPTTTPAGDAGQRVQAGPALDAEIERRVFGMDVLGMTTCQPEPECGTLEIAWHAGTEQDVCRPVALNRRPFPSQRGLACGCLDGRKEDDPPLIFGHDRHCVRLDVVPEYSSDLAAAWLVVERLLARLPHGDLHLQHHAGDGWTVLTCYDDDEAGWSGDATAQTLPEAICRAALAALGEGE